jgi:prolipoprotein diacylglyceryl transferase
VSLLFSIPSPDQGVWQLGPIPIRAYAFAIIIGIIVAVKWGSARLVARGGSPEDVANVAMYAVPFGIVGGRLYHVITDAELYFGPNGRGLIATLRIWDGGLGIWGAIALGFVGGVIGCRRYGINLGLLADAVAPGVVLAQAIGRIGNYFNQELFGSPTDLPWGLEIDFAHRPTGFTNFATFHPTFLYELLWNVAVAFALVYAEKRWNLIRGQVFALYVALYCSGRVWVEMLRIDTANHFFGLRLNVFTAVLVGLGAVGWLIWSRRKLDPAELLTPHS